MACVSPHLIITAPSCFTQCRTGIWVVIASLYNLSAGWNSTTIQALDRLSKFINVDFIRWGKNILWPAQLIRFLRLIIQYIFLAQCPTFNFNHSSCLRDAQYTYITNNVSVQSLCYWLYITIVWNLTNKSTLTLIKSVAVCPLKAGLRFLMFTKAFWTS